MGLLRKLLGLGKKTVTPDEMADVVLDAAMKLALHGDGSLQKILRSADVRPQNEGQFQAELIVYQLFLLDVIVNRAFGEEAQPIRWRMRERFADLAARAVREAGVEPQSREGYIAFLEDRFGEYAPALQRSMESQGAPERGALALPEAVLRNVARSPEMDPWPATALYVQWLEIFKHYPDAFQKYEIVKE